MSMAERSRHNSGSRKEGSKARSQQHKFEVKKHTAVINHINYERHHGYESTKHQSKSET